MMSGAAITRGFAAALSFTTAVLLGPANLLLAQDSAPKPIVSDTPLTPEQLAVYRALLVGWFQREKFAVNLADRTSPANSPADEDCAKGLSVEKKGKDVHRFQQADLPQLGLESNIHLVDPDAHAQQVREHDPGSAIRNGKSVDDAVTDGFAHGLFTLGEILFDHTHTHAVVSFSFWCGSLCGHGSTMLLEKKNGEWKQKKQCGGWMS